MTTMQEYAHNKPLQYARGGVLGGSSTTNYMVSVRGLPSDFDELWTKAEGLIGWMAIQRCVTLLPKVRACI